MMMRQCTAAARPSTEIRESRLGAMLAGCWHRYLVWRLQRETVKALHSLSDRSLSDIGLDRSQIESEVAELGRRLVAGQCR